MEQEHFVEFDVSHAETSVYVVDETGKVVWQADVRLIRRRWLQLSDDEHHVSFGSHFRLARGVPGITVAWPTSVYP